MRFTNPGLQLTRNRIALLAAIVVAGPLLWAGCNDSSGPCDWCGDGSTLDGSSSDAALDGTTDDQGTIDSATADGSGDALSDVDPLGDGSRESAAGTCTGSVCPTSVEAKGSWFATPSNTEVDGYDSVTFDLKLKNATNVSLTVNSIQVWSLPGIIDLPLNSSNLPVAGIAVGAEFDLSFTVDLSSLASCQPGVALRPVSEEKGVLSPTNAPLVAVNKITCTR